MIWKVFVVTAVVAGFWITVLYLNQESKRMGVTHQTDIYFLEPIVNLGCLGTILSYLWAFGLY